MVEKTDPNRTTAIFMEANIFLHPINMVQSISKEIITTNFFKKNIHLGKAQLFYIKYRSEASSSSYWMHVNPYLLNLRF